MEHYAALLKGTFYLILVVITAYLVIRFGLRLVYPGTGGGLIKVLGRVPLDMKTGSNLVLVQMGERILLLGMAQGSITLLKEIPVDSLPVSGEGEGMRREPPGGTFNRILKLMRKNEDRGN